MKIRPNYLFLSIDILLSLILYFWIVEELYSNPESYLSNFFIFFVPILLVVGSIGLGVGGPIPSWMDSGTQHKRKYTLYLSAYVVGYHLLAAVFAAFSWYWWASFALLKGFTYYMAKRDYVEAIDQKIFEESLEREEENA